jgi:FkbM family methyltransferase
MSQCFIKSIALWGISKGLHLPEALLDRVNELSLLRGLLSQLKIDCVLDVGANCGQFARELRGFGYRGQIISFEPIPSEFLAMKEQFKNDPHWSGYQLALGSKRESMKLCIPKLTVLSSLLESNDLLESFLDESDTREETVEVRRLDDMLPSILEEYGTSRVFLKMDTQGFDLEVFRGASGCLDRIQGIQSELSIQPLYKNMPPYLDALEVYEAEGFKLHNLSVVNRVGNGGLLELNCYMRRDL